MKRLAGGVALLMAGITAVSLGVTALLGLYRTEQTEGFSIMASFYPVYTAALNVAGALLRTMTIKLQRQKSGVVCVICSTRNIRMLQWLQSGAIPVSYTHLINTVAERF